MWCVYWEINKPNQMFILLEYFVTKLLASSDYIIRHMLKTSFYFMAINHSCQYLFINSNNVMLIYNCFEVVCPHFFSATNEWISMKLCGKILRGDIHIVFLARLDHYRLCLWLVIHYKVSFVSMLFLST